MAKSIETLAVNRGNSDNWHVQLFGSLVDQLFSEDRLAKREFCSKRNADASLLAWWARNL